MKTHFAASAVLLLLSGWSAWAYESPANAVSRGRVAIAEKNFALAVELLQGAIPAVESITDPEEQRQALASIHFYSAVAFTSLDERTRARRELMKFFELMPNMNRVDGSKYSAGFVAIFNAVAAEVAAATDGTFDKIYPRPVMLSRATDGNLALWGASPEFQLLATKDEKKEWATRRDAAKQQEFVDQFWARRDPTPADDRNEFRDEFLDRVAFADHAFRSGTDRGSLTHRGRVYVLLGKPAAVKQRGLTPRDARMSVGVSGQLYKNQGEVETWNYFAAKLPAKVPGSVVTFRFKTQNDHGDHVLDFETFSQRALTAAAEAALKR